jgi:hypothetical protein
MSVSQVPYVISKYHSWSITVHQIYFEGKHKEAAAPSSPLCPVWKKDLFKSEDSESSVNMFTAEYMRKWICGVCRHFGHAAWLCPSVSEEVRLQARDLR